MTSNVKTIPKIAGFPSHWPRDKKSRLTQRDGEIFLTHPERKAQKFDVANNRWSEADAG